MRRALVGSIGVNSRVRQRYPPKPYTTAIHVPAADARCSPSRRLPAVSARSTASASTRYSSAVRYLPASAAAIAWMHSDSDESPVVSAS